MDTPAVSSTTPSPWPPTNTSVALINTFGCPCRQYPNHTPSPSPLAPAFDDTLEASQESLVLWIFGIWFLASFIGVKLAEEIYMRPRRPNYGLWGLVVIAAAGAIKSVAAEATTAPIPTMTNLGPERQQLSGYTLTPILTVGNGGFVSAAPSTGLPLRSIALVGLIVTLIVASTMTAKYAALNYRDSPDERQTDIAEAYHDKHAGLEKSQATIEDASQSIFAPRQPKRKSAGVTRIAALLVLLILAACLMPVVLADPSGTSAINATASMAMITSIATLNGSNGTWWMQKGKPQSWFVNAGSRQTVSWPLALVASVVGLLSRGDRLRRIAAPTRVRVPSGTHGVAISAQGRRSISRALVLIVAGLTVAALLPLARAAGTSYPISNATACHFSSYSPDYTPDHGSASLRSANLLALACALLGIALVRNTPPGRGIFAAVFLAFACLLPLALAENIGDSSPVVNISDLTNSTTGDSLTWVPAAVSDAVMLSKSWPTIALGLVSISVAWTTLTGRGIFVAIVLTLTSLLPLTLAQANGPLTIYVAPGPGSQSGGGISNPHHNAGVPRAGLSWLTVAVAMLCLVGIARGSISLPAVLESEGATATAAGATPSLTRTAEATVSLPASTAPKHEPLGGLIDRSRRPSSFFKKIALSLAVICILAFLVPSASAQRTSETTGVTVMVGPPMQHTRPTQGPITARGAPQTPPPAYTATYVDASSATTTLTINREALDGINFRLRSQGQRTAPGPFRVDWASLTAALWGFAAGVALVLGMLV
ncbi:hypothetical protein B0A48_13081 [Cryoendolithus antarcticus]|uniref:Uncharacterized protein n=1 Tax=Cryoendolithus antarcticus TaxID=1507870 RepID=A0A1V8SNQ2_9PEZI|nr:hypothetical protein B0A48_13081 [Cryoendolithus antarcticus]